MKISIIHSSHMSIVSSDVENSCTLVRGKLVAIFKTSVWYIASPVCDKTNNT